MKASIVLSVLVVALFCSYVSSTVIDAWRVNAGDPNLQFPIAAATYINGTSYTASTVQSPTVNGRPDPQLLFRQRDLNIALTSKTDTNTGGSLSFTSVSVGNFYELNLGTAANAGGVYTVVYDAVETGSSAASLPPACTSTFNNPVLLDSSNCLSTPTGITLLSPDAAIDLTRGGTNFAFVLPVDALLPPNSTFPAIIRVWGVNGTSSVLRLDYATSVSMGQLVFEYSRFNGTASFRQILGLALQFQLAPGQNVTFSAFQALGVTLVKTMILFDDNEDGIANPGETVQMSISINKPMLPPTVGSWTFSWIDQVSTLVLLQPASLSYTSNIQDGSTAIPSAGSDNVQLQLSSPAGSPANVYTVTFLTTVRPVPDNTIRNLTNNATMTFSLSSELNITYSLVAAAPVIQVAGSPYLIIDSTCPGVLASNQQGTIFYTVTNNGTINADNVAIIQTFSPPSGVISSYDPNWDCSANTANATVSCTYLFQQPIGYPGNFAGTPTSASVNFTFTVSESLDCSLTSLNLVSRVESGNSNTGAFYNSFEAANCSIALTPTVNLTVVASLVGNEQTATLGTTIYYNANYINNGNSPAYDIEIVDNFPANTVPVIPPSANWVCDNATNVCVYSDNMGPLQPGQTRSVLIGLFVENDYTGPFVCNSFSLTTSNPASQYCSASANSNEICLPAVGGPNNNNNGTTTSPTPTNCPPIPSPSPCVYCLAGSTINISMKSLMPSSSCSGGNCKRR